MTEELKPLDEQKLHDFIFNFSGGNRPCGGGQDMELLIACRNLSRAICQRFGQPTIPSVGEK